MKRLFLFLLIVSAAAGAEVKRPRILGVAHISLYVSSLGKARTFYQDLLGYEPLPIKSGSVVQLAVYKVNDNQYIELVEEPPRSDGRLGHIGFYTDDVKGMREYLASRAVKVPETIGKGRLGNPNFSIKDVDGHIVEFVQYVPDSLTSREKGKRISAARASDDMRHLGILIGTLDPALKFYSGILGFEETWRGGGSPRQLSWVNMKVPDGRDYIEFMLYGTPPDERQRGVKNHICLFVPDVKQAVAQLDAKPARKGYNPGPIAVTVGRNGRRQANLFDPDGTRVELMEPNTVDGEPVPSSTAPPPR